MSFLAEGTPINKETIDEAVEAIALACALGVRQQEAILQMIEHGKLDTHLISVPGTRGMGRQTAHAFTCGLGHKSWMGMVKRLKRSGFSVSRVTHEKTGTFTYRLYWGTPILNTEGEET